MQFRRASTLPAASHCFPGSPMLRFLRPILAFSAAALLCVLSTSASAQLIARTMPEAVSANRLAGAPSAMAVRVSQAPTLDGITTDPIWAQATVIDDFREYEPDEGTESRFRTE